MITFHGFLTRGYRRTSARFPDVHFCAFEEGKQKKLNLCMYKCVFKNERCLPSVIAQRPNLEFQNLWSGVNKFKVCIRIHGLSLELLENIVLFFLMPDIFTSELKDQKERLCKLLSATSGGIFQLPF